MSAAFLTRTALVAVACVAAAALVGWLVPLSPEAPVRVQGPVTAPVFVHPGPVVAEAARRLGAPAPADATAQAEDAPDTSIDVTPAAPPVDVADLFRRELSAVIVEGEERAVLVAADGAVRRIREGAPWRDGWRVADVAPGAVVIARRKEVRRIAVMGAMPVGVVAGADPSAPRERLVLTRAEAKRGRR